MPIRSHSAALLLAGLCAAGPLMPAAAQETRLSEPAGGFSYLPPAGWHIRTLPGLKYKVCFAKPVNGFAPNINTVDEVAPVPMGPYIQASIAQMKRAYANLHVLSQKPFVTASGVHGVRMVTDGLAAGKHMHQVFYVFPGANSRKYVLTASFLASDGSKYDAVTDASMKTFTLK